MSVRDLADLLDVGSSDGVGASPGESKTIDLRVRPAWMTERRIGGDVDKQKVKKNMINSNEINDALQEYVASPQGQLILNDMKRECSKVSGQKTETRIKNYLASKRGSGLLRQLIERVLANATRVKFDDPMAQARHDAMRANEVDAFGHKKYDEPASSYCDKTFVTNVNIGRKK